MKTEYEVRMLDIDFANMINKVENLGATKIGSYHQRRYVYDFIPAQKGRWIRLRSNGTETTLTIKEVKSTKIDGTKELEIIVSDLKKTNEILQKLGYNPRTFQENFRIEYRLNGVNFDFDKWPMIPPYLEIEGESQQAVLSAMKELNIDMESITTMDVDMVYRKQYGIDLDSIQMLQFSDSEKELVNKYLNEKKGVI